MQSWLDPQQRLPDEKEEVVIRVRGEVRNQYYRIDGHWYAMGDIDRWQMNTSPYWPRDRSWYVKTEDVEGWRAH